MCDFHQMSRVSFLNYEMDNPYNQNVYLRMALPFIIKWRVGSWDKLVGVLRPYQQRYTDDILRNMLT